MRRPASTAAAAVLAVFLVVSPLPAAEDDWSALMVVRLCNIDAIDAEDGELARFIRDIRNDGLFTPPVLAVVGPEIRNPTFFGIAYEAWMECVLLAPVESGALRHVWVFPVENRDEYMTQLASLGLSEYEGMDGVTILREVDSDGNVQTWHMEWLPGNVAVFGRDRAAVGAAHRLYTENSAAQGLVRRPGTAAFMEPDVLVRMFPPALATWQETAVGEYWWRDTVRRLADDLLTYWRPTPARARLIDSFAEEMTLWPGSVTAIDVSLWLEDDGVEWEVSFAGDFPDSPKSDLPVLRRLPERTALAWAAPLLPETVAGFFRDAGAFVLAAAGGVAPPGARGKAEDIANMLLRGAVRQAAFAWVPPPAGKPEAGGVRMLVTEWDRPEAAERAWGEVLRLAGTDAAWAQVFAQLGLAVRVTLSDADPFAADIVVRPAAAEAPVYSRMTLTLRRNGGCLVLVVGESPEDAGAKGDAAAYRAALAEETAAATGPGNADVREAFTQAGPDGTGFLAFLEPVRFLQFCLIEAGDWAPRSPDQHEPLSTQLAREMLEYRSGRAWTAAGDSLARLAAALGVTEAVGGEDE